MCKICKFSASSEDKILTHIKETHPNESERRLFSDFEEDEEDSSDESIIESFEKRKYRSSEITQISADNTSRFNKMR